jgi:hypothetical protein
MRQCLILIGLLAMISACSGPQRATSTRLTPLAPREQFVLEGNSTATTTPIRLRGDYLVAWTVSWDNPYPDNLLWCTAYMFRLDRDQIGEDATYKSGFPIFEVILPLENDRIGNYEGITEISGRVDGNYGITSDGLSDTDYVLEITALQPQCTYRVAL